MDSDHHDRAECTVEEAVWQQVAAIAAATQPFSARPSALYRPDDLTQGFDRGGFLKMFDSRLYVYSNQMADAGGPRFLTAQLAHDAAMRTLLLAELEAWRSIGTGALVAVMGGHATRRGSAGYRQAVRLGWMLGRAGHLVVTGGGPGVMEAVNLGAYLTGHPSGAIEEAVAHLAQASDPGDGDAYTAAAIDVRTRFAVDQSQERDPARVGGLAIATWRNEDIPQPANLFAARTAKFVGDAFPEDLTLSLCRGKVIFAPGRAGTVQEVFQAVTKLFYASHEAMTGPIVCLGREFWNGSGVPGTARQLLTQARAGDLSRLLLVIDDLDEVLAAFQPAGHGASNAASHRASAAAS